MDEEEFEDCARCGEEHPAGVLEDDLCPACCDDELDGEDINA